MAMLARAARQAAELTIASAAVVGLLAGCPQLISDDFRVVEPDSGASGAGGSGGGTPCGGGDSCPSGRYCDPSDRCVPQKPVGTACAEGQECLSSYCVDEVCCNDACEDACLACSAALTGDASGQCTVALAGCSCDEQYTDAAIHEPCAQTDKECQLRIDTTTASCGAVCRAGGGECLEVYNDAPSETCNIDDEEPLACDADSHSSVICICSRGCGGGPPCVSPSRCVEDSCA